MRLVPVFSVLISVACSTNKNITKTSVKLETSKDTLNYLTKKFVDRKDIFIGKSINKLYSNSTLPVKYYVLSLDAAGDSIFSVLLVYQPKEEFERNIDDGKLTSHIVVRLKNRLPADKFLKLMRKNKGNWTKDEEDFFGKEIVKDINVTKY